MLISVKQVLLILAVISWSCLPKQSVLEAFSLHFWRKPRTFHTRDLYGVAEEEAFRERVSRQTRQEQQWENVPQWHSQEGPYSIDSPHYTQKHWPEISLVPFQPARPNLHGIAIRRGCSLICNQVAHQPSSGAIVNFSLSFCSSAENCQISIYDHPLEFLCPTCRTSILTTLFCGIQCLCFCSCHQSLLSNSFPFSSDMPISLPHSFPKNCFNVIGL